MKLKLCIQEITSVIYLYLITLKVISLLLQLYCNADTYTSVTLFAYKMTFVNLFAMEVRVQKLVKLLKLQNKCHHDLVKSSPPPPFTTSLAARSPLWARWSQSLSRASARPFCWETRTPHFGLTMPLPAKIFKPRDSSGVSLHELENWRIRKIILVCNLKGNINRFVFGLPVYGTFQTEITHHIGWPRTNSQIHVVGDEGKTTKISL